MIFYKDNKMPTVYSQNNKKYIIDDLAESMKNILSNKTASQSLINNKSEELINNLNRSSELFEDLGNVKAAEIITKIIEKVAGK